MSLKIICMWNEQNNKNNHDELNVTQHIKKLQDNTCVLFLLFSTVTKISRWFCFKNSYLILLLNVRGHFKFRHHNISALQLDTFLYPLRANSYSALAPTCRISGKILFISGANFLHTIYFCVAAENGFVMCKTTPWLTLWVCIL
jgi:hypothetical protein